MKQDPLQFPYRGQTAGPEQTLALAAQLSARLQPGHVVFLRGDLGAGKTHFVRGICQGLGMRHLFEVDSPTYTIINHYDVGPGVDHIDLYRLSGPDDLEEIGFEDLLASSSIKLIEWPERLLGYPMDPPDLVVRLVNHEGDTRLIHILDKDGFHDQ